MSEVRQTPQGHQLRVLRTLRLRETQEARMTPRKFNRFMVDVKIGSNLELQELTPAERWCYVAGFLSIAAEAPIRGRLIVGTRPASVTDYAKCASVTTKIAASTLAKLVGIGVVSEDPENDCLMVESFEDWNPPPKNDKTAPERMRRYRAKMKERNAAAVTTTVTDLVTHRNNRNVTPGREEKGIEGEEHHLATKPLGSTPLKSLGGTNDAGATGEVWS